MQAMRHDTDSGGPALSALGLGEVGAASVIFGMTIVFAKLVPVPAWAIIEGRAFFGALALLLLGLALGRPPALPGSGARARLALAGLGLSAALQWTCLFTAAQVSSVALAILVFSAHPIVVALVEAAMRRQRPAPVQFWLAGLVLAGTAVLVPGERAAGQPVLGAALALLASGAHAAGILIKKHGLRATHTSLSMAFWEHAQACVLLSPLLLIAPGRLWEPSTLALLALLGTAFSALPRFLVTDSLRTLPAWVTSLVITTEPIPAALFAALLVGEVPGWNTALGGGLILSAVCWEILGRRSPAGPVR